MTSPSSPVPAVEAEPSNEILLDVFRRAVLNYGYGQVGIEYLPIAEKSLSEARAAVLARMSTPTPGRAAEPDAMAEVERLAEEALIRANLAGLSGNVDYLMAEYRSASDAYKAALASLVTRAETAEAQLATQGWQDISTVPQTGDVLLWLRAPHARVEIARWDWLLDCFVSTDEMTEIGKLMPSHWMPLPASPTLSTSRADR